MAKKKKASPARRDVSAAGGALLPASAAAKTRVFLRERVEPAAPRRIVVADPPAHEEAAPAAASETAETRKARLLGMSLDAVIRAEESALRAEKKASRAGARPQLKNETPRLVTRLPGPVAGAAPAVLRPAQARSVSLKPAVPVPSAPAAVSAASAAAVDGGLGAASSSGRSVLRAEGGVGAGRLFRQAMVGRGAKGASVSWDRSEGPAVAVRLVAAQTAGPADELSEREEGEAEESCARQKDGAAAEAQAPCVAALCRGEAPGGSRASSKRTSVEEGLICEDDEDGTDRKRPPYSSRKPEGTGASRLLNGTGVQLIAAASHNRARLSSRTPLGVRLSPAATGSPTPRVKLIGRDEAGGSRLTGDDEIDAERGEDAAAAEGGDEETPSSLDAGGVPRKVVLAGDGFGAAGERGLQARRRAAAGGADATAAPEGEVGAEDGAARLTAARRNAGLSASRPVSVGARGLAEVCVQKPAPVKSGEKKGKNKPTRGDERRAARACLQAAAKAAAASSSALRVSSSRAVVVDREAAQGDRALCASPKPAAGRRAGAGASIGRGDDEASSATPGSGSPPARLAEKETEGARRSASPPPPEEDARHRGGRASAGGGLRGRGASSAVGRGDRRAREEDSERDTFARAERKGAETDAWGVSRGRCDGPKVLGGRAGNPILVLPPPTSAGTGDRRDGGWSGEDAARRVMRRDDSREERGEGARGVLQSERLARDCRGRRLDGSLSRQGPEEPAGRASTAGEKALLRGRAGRNRDLSPSARSSASHRDREQAWSARTQDAARSPSLSRPRSGRDCRAGGASRSPSARGDRRQGFSVRDAEGRRRDRADDLSRSPGPLEGKSRRRAGTRSPRRDSRSRSLERARPVAPGTWGAQRQTTRRGASWEDRERQRSVSPSPQRRRGDATTVRGAPQEGGRAAAAEGSARGGKGAAQGLPEEREGERVDLESGERREAKDGEGEASFSSARIVILSGTQERGASGRGDGAVRDAAKKRQRSRSGSREDRARRASLDAAIAPQNRSSSRGPEGRAPSPQAKRLRRTDEPLGDPRARSPLPASTDPVKRDGERRGVRSRSSSLEQHCARQGPPAKNVGGQRGGAARGPGTTGPLPHPGARRRGSSHGGADRDRRSMSRRGRSVSEHVSRGPSPRKRGRQASPLRGRDDRFLRRGSRSRSWSTGGPGRAQRGGDTRAAPGGRGASLSLRRGGGVPLSAKRVDRGRSVSASTHSPRGRGGRSPHSLSPRAGAPAGRKWSHGRSYESRRWDSRDFGRSRSATPDSRRGPSSRSWSGSRSPSEDRRRGPYRRGRDRARGAYHSSSSYSLSPSPRRGLRTAYSSRSSSPPGARDRLRGRHGDSSPSPVAKGRGYRRSYSPRLEEARAGPRGRGVDGRGYEPRRPGNQDPPSTAGRRLPGSMGPQPDGDRRHEGPPRYDAPGEAAVGSVPVVLRTRRQREESQEERPMMKTARHPYAGPVVLTPPTSSRHSGPAHPVVYRPHGPAGAQPERRGSTGPSRRDGRDVDGDRPYGLGGHASGSSQDDPRMGPAARCYDDPRRGPPVGGGRGEPELDLRRQAAGDGARGARLDRAGDSLAGHGRSAQPTMPGPDDSPPRACREYVLGRRCPAGGGAKCPFLHPAQRDFFKFDQHSLRLKQTYMHEAAALGWTPSRRHGGARAPDGDRGRVEPKGPAGARRLDPRGQEPDSRRRHSGTDEGRTREEEGRRDRRAAESAREKKTGGVDQTEQQRRTGDERVTEEKAGGGDDNEEARREPVQRSASQQRALDGYFKKQTAEFLNAESYMEGWCKKELIEYFYDEYLSQNMTKEDALASATAYVERPEEYGLRRTSAEGGRESASS
ncbi:hypothetical protein BESB_018360 [Besnoitia besnoiti]|uniref:C3H1-type domain-containing protein n=1 Tax=Besnoitia besnoiti TaxID=94643 RepID=A0A2A9M1Z4_BESBE|nr:hypothetical protein BESB_018360 [Besnoitia besnoiti]PFH32518.1 hypothetical protein BESB_018360 [Besnoitia besnoiti]